MGSNRSLPLSESKTAVGAVPMALCGWRVGASTLYRLARFFNPGWGVQDNFRPRLPQRKCAAGQRDANWSHSKADKKRVLTGAAPVCDAYIYYEEAWSNAAITLAALYDFTAQLRDEPCRPF